MTRTTPAEAAAHRARIIAAIARDRFAPPASLTALRFIAAHLDQADSAFERSRADASGIDSLTVAADVLDDARQLAALHPATRLPVTFTEYVTAPLTGDALPMPDPLNPASTVYAMQEAELRAALEGAHRELRADASEAAVDAWLPTALHLHRDLMMLADLVRADNSRPAHQH